MNVWIHKKGNKSFFHTFWKTNLQTHALFDKILENKIKSCKFYSGVWGKIFSVTIFLSLLELFIIKIHVLYTT